MAPPRESDRTRTRVGADAEKPAITLTPAQLEQLADFRTERKGIDRTVRLREAPNLGTDYVEAILLDSDGEETTDKRILFPN